MEEFGTSSTCVTVSRRRRSDFKQEELITEKRVLTERARTVLAEVFARFSIEGKMTVKKCEEFARAVTSNPRVTPNEKAVSDLFANFGEKGKDYLTLEQFLRFYEDSAQKRPRAVWDNLSALGYRPDLKKFDDDTASQQVPADKLPRYLLANTPKYFGLLFDLFRTFACFRLINSMDRL